MAESVLIVLHGFNSANPNAKAEFLARHLPRVPRYCPSYSHDPDQAASMLLATADQAQADHPQAELCVLGTSLGAFWARWLTRQRGDRAILINPALDPAQTLRRYLGWNTNLKTGERYRLEPVHLAAYRPYYTADGGVPTLVLLDMADELLDSAATAQRFTGRSDTRVVCWEGGEHRFAHLGEALPEICRFMPGGCPPAPSPGR